MEKKQLQIVKNESLNHHNFMRITSMLQLLIYVQNLYSYYYKPTESISERVSEIQFQACSTRFNAKSSTVSNQVL